MIESIRNMDLDVCCIGNHDFDFGSENLTKLLAKLDNPWLLSNMRWKDRTPICNLKEYHILERNGVKIGFLGLGSEEWVETLFNFTMDDLDYEEPSECANRLGKFLKEDNKCDLVISLNHMRTNDDKKLALGSNFIDFAQGGHDHILHSCFLNGLLTQKSGVDFKTFSHIEVDIGPFTDERRENIKSDPEIHRQDVDVIEKNWKNLDTQKFYVNRNENELQITVNKISVSQDDPIDEKTQSQVQDYIDKIEEIFKEPCLLLNSDYDATFSTIRTRETPLCNFISNIILNWSGFDITLIQSGHIRCDKIMRKGEVLTKKQVYQILPINDEICGKIFVYIIGVELTGNQLQEVINRGCNRTPTQDGGFANFTGLKASFDSSRDKDARMDGQNFYIKKFKASICKRQRVRPRKNIHIVSYPVYN